MTSLMKKINLIMNLHLIKDVMRKLTLMKDIKSEVSTDEEDEVVSAGVLSEMYEIEKGINTDRFSSLTNENNCLKKELRIIKSQLNRYYEKTQEILKILEDEKLNEKTKNNSDNNNDQNEKNYEIRKITSEYPFEELNSSNKNISYTYFAVDEFYVNLSKIRECIKLDKIKLRNYNKLKENKNLQFQNITTNTLKTISTTNHNRVTITKTDILNGIDNNSALYETVPRLIPEEFVSNCCGCEKKFSTCRWKYHCRVCGYVFCFYCSWNFSTFIPFYTENVRICDKCVCENKNKCYTNIN